MTLKTKCIKAGRSVSDGLRISVMSRHTLNDGITPDPEITRESFDEWWQNVSPEPSLIGSYYKRGLSWEKFAERFKEFLSSSEIQERLKELISLSRKGNVTILCVEKSPEFCHRRLIGEECRKLEPSLNVVIE